MVTDLQLGSVDHVGPIVGQVKLYGPAEVMKRLNISRQRLTQLQSRPTFPKPLDKIAAGYIWDAADIERWIASTARSGFRRTTSRRSPLASESRGYGRLGLRLPTCLDSGDLG